MRTCTMKATLSPDGKGHCVVLSSKQCWRGSHVFLLYKLFVVANQSVTTPPPPCALRPSEVGSFGVELNNCCARGMGGGGDAEYIVISEAVIEGGLSLCPTRQNSVLRRRGAGASYHLG